MLKITKITDVIKQIDDIEVAIFDLDDTLFSEKEYEKSGYEAIGRAYPEIEKLSDKLWTASQHCKYAIDEVLKTEGIISKELKNEWLRIYRFHKPNIHLYDGVEEMLKCLVSAGLKLGIITDGRVEGQTAKIEALSLEEYFEKIIITDSLGGIEFRKPNEKAFLLMQEYFGVEFNKMAYIGDNLSKDFVAPQKLGMKAIYFVNEDSSYYVEG